jgi:hypothetical protein
MFLGLLFSDFSFRKCLKWNVKNLAGLASLAEYVFKSANNL